MLREQIYSFYFFIVHRTAVRMRGIVYRTTVTLENRDSAESAPLSAVEDLRNELITIRSTVLHRGPRPVG